MADQDAGADQYQPDSDAYSAGNPHGRRVSLRSDWTGICAGAAETRFFAPLRTGFAALRMTEGGLGVTEARSE